MKSRFLAISIWLTALLAPTTAAAAELCVQTLNDLINGLQIAALGPQPDDTMTLRLVAQTYVWSGSGGGGLDIFNSWSRLNILGGYNADCTTRTVDANNTVIDGVGQLGLVLSTRGQGITVEGIRFQNLFQLSFENRTTCTDQGQRYTFRRNIVLPGNAFGFSVDCQDVRFENNLVIGGGDRYLQTYDSGSARQFFVVNNTFVNGGGDGLSLFRHEDSAALEVRLYNNVIWNNVGQGLVQYAGSAPIDVLAYRNTWDSVVTPLVVDDGNVIGDPQLDGAFRPIEPGSPVINTGLIGITGGLPAVDLDGGPRVIGSTVDRGAYESAVDNSQALVVSNTNDSGAGSLRQAILNANASPNLVNRIVFQFDGCPGIIDLESSLPAITDHLIVDGYSQAGSSPNTSEIGNNAVYCVVLRNDDAELGSAFSVPSTAVGKRLELSGVAIGGFSAAVLLAGGSNHAILGNHFGPGLYSGPADLAGGDWNVLVAGDGVSGVQIGGSAPAERNTVAGATIGIQIAGSGGNHSIINNYVGTTRDGNATNSDVRNGRGLLLNGSGIVVIDNLVSGNSTGIVIEGSDNVLVSNRIGVKALAFCFNPPCPPSTFSVPNIDGVRIGGGSEDAVNNTFWANTVAYNSVYGVILYPDAQNNTLTANRIYDNGFIGIDLYGPDGVNPNDNDTSVSPGTVANDGQNYPVLSFAGGGKRAGRVRGTLSTHPGQDFRVELFSSPACDDSGYGQGRNYHGSANVDVPFGGVGQNGTVQFDIALPEASGIYLDGRAITATATDAGRDTSEFSACVEYECDVIFAHDLESAAADTCPAL